MAALGEQRRSNDSIIWDFDGVLADSRVLAWKTGSEILQLLGLDIVISDQETFRDHFVRPTNRPQLETNLLASMHRLVMRTRATQIAFFPSLDLVSSTNVPNDIVTSGLAEVARKALGRKAALFRNIRGREDGDKSALLKRCSPRSLFVTDTGVDICRGRNRGLTVVAVGWGYDPAPVLEAEHPTFFARTNEELGEILRSLALLNHSGGKGSF